MKLNDTQLNYFVNSVLHLGPGKKAEFLDQVDRVITILQAKMNESTDFKVKGFLKTGSIMKGTVLKPRAGSGVDADVAVFIDVSEAEKEDKDELHKIIIDLLAAAYPQKSRNDFKVQPRTVGVHFHTSGLDMDLVPVVPIKSNPGFGWQLSSGDAPPVKTNIQGQLNFIKGRKKQDKYFKSTVRILKHWRNFNELDKLKSFTIELIVCYLLDKHGVAQRLEDAVNRFFLFLAQTAFKEIIYFPENGIVRNYPKDPVVVLDPVNSENNVTMRLTNEERMEIVETSSKAWNTISYAQQLQNKGDTIELWKEVLGRSFKIED